MNIQNINGLIAAPPTGFTEDGKVDFSVIEPLAEHLKEQGVIGVFINGTTGEGMSLSSLERKELAVQWHDVLPKGMKLFVHTGQTSIEESKELAHHAQTVGADAVASIAPGFYKPNSIDDIINWCAPIASTAPELPFYFYYMPSMNGVHMNIRHLLEKIKTRIPNFAGVKFTFETMGEYFETVTCNPELNILWGRDEMLLGALAMGAKGAVGSIYNIVSPLFLNLIKCFEIGKLKESQNIQFKIIKLINIINKSDNFFSSLKGALALQGIPISLKTRVPLRTLTEEQSRVLIKNLQNWNKENSLNFF